MAKELKTKSTSLQELEKTQRSTKLQIEHLYSKVSKQQEYIRKILNIWDAVFKVFGVALTVTVIGVVLAITQSLYYHNGKWNFSVVVVGAIICIAAMILGILLTWFLVDLFLVRKMNICDRCD